MYLLLMYTPFTYVSLKSQIRFKLNTKGKNPPLFHWNPIYKRSVKNKFKSKEIIWGKEKNKFKQTNEYKKTNHMIWEQITGSQQ